MTHEQIEMRVVHLGNLTGRDYKLNTRRTGRRAYNLEYNRGACVEIGPKWFSPAEFYARINTFIRGVELGKELCQ